MTDILFGDWLPDQPDHLASGLATISNAYPGATGYRPVGAFTATTDALPARCQGASSFVSPSGRAVVLAGTAGGIYRQISGGWEVIGTGYSTPNDGRWRFVPFGALAVATNGANKLQSVNLESGAVIDLEGNPPVFSMLAVVQNFLVGGVLNGDVRAVGWSGENNAGFWTFGSRKSDYQIMADGGEVTGLVGGERGLVLQRTCVRLMTYVGGNSLFRFDKIASNIGCVTVHSVSQFGDLAFWYSDSGFQMWNGSTIKAIGFEKVDATFAKAYGVRSWPLMSASIDGPRNTACWSMGDRIWCYNWNLDRWTVIDVAAEIIFAGVTKTVSLDEQDPAIGAPDDNTDYPGLDSFDDARFQGGDPRFYVVSTDHRLGTFSGANLAASFGLRNMELAKGRDARVQRVRPMSDVTTGVALTIEARQRLGDAAVARLFSTLNRSGEMPVRSRGRFIKPTFAIADAQPWTYAQGLDVSLVAAGRR